MPLMSTGGGGEGDTDAVSDAVGDGDTVRDGELPDESEDVGEAVGEAVGDNDTVRDGVFDGEGVGDGEEVGDGGVALHSPCASWIA